MTKTSDKFAKFANKVLTSEQASLTLGGKAAELADQDAKKCGWYSYSEGGTTKYIEVYDNGNVCPSTFQHEGKTYTKI
ncbi:MAG: hypothetical protein MUC49_22400 [Raineya sp.]|jgi:hypothetical protein|nr:hypothetical protein [Raineya sp.]